ncbi:MAG: PAS domain S-box protein [Syntrophorhabdaceae bacterium]|nr:PAS domain S-box protein [Syntrophorhabdaceae bacterium]
MKRTSKGNTANSVFAGALFGGAAIAAMNLPFYYAPGIIYDGRSIILSLGGLFGGPVSGVISMVIAGIYRLHIGGEGVWAGLATIIFCTIAGIQFRQMLDGKTDRVSILSLYIFGICVHIIMIACQMLLILTPGGVEIIRKIWLPVMVIFPLATVLMGIFLRDEEIRIKTKTERQVAEDEVRKLNEELRAKTERLENIIEATEIGTWEWNIKTGETVFNKRWAEIVGYSLDELSPTNFDTWVRLVHPDDLIKSNTILERYFRGETDVYECECRLRHKDGHWVWILDRGRVIKWDDEGKPLVMFGFHLDISERKKMEEKVREGERFLSTLINNIPGFVYRCMNDRDWTMKYISEQVETITGYSADELIENKVISYNDIIHPDFRESVWEQVENGLRHIGFFEIYYPVVTKRGDIRWVWEKGRGIYSEEGELRYLEGFVTDITETRLKEEAYLESESKLIAVTEAAQDAIVMIDGEGRVTFWNPAAERMFGYREEEAMGRDVHELIAPERFYETFKKMFPDFVMTGKGGAVGRTLELVAKKSSGEEFPVELSLSAIEIHSAWHSIAIIRDITERKKAEEERKKLEIQFLQAQKLESIGRLAGGVAHDFNNILSVIIGYGEIIQTRLLEDDPLKDYVNQIVEAGKKAAGLTNQLLAFSRKQILKPVPIDLNDLLRNIEKMLKRLIGEDINLRLLLTDRLPAIFADPGQIEQVIMNLAVNARDAMPHGGILTIETSTTLIEQTKVIEYGWFKPGRYVLLTVSDTGSGIKKETLEHIFEPFFTTKKTGTGLGLATVYGIVKQSDGVILVDSDEGKGTTFRVYLPVVEIDGVHEREDKNKKQVIEGGKGQHILVVEDEEMVRNFIHTALTQKGFVVTTANNGIEAIELIEKQGLKPDLLITDVVMPGMSGSVLAERIGEIMPELKILFMSGYTEEAMIKHGLADRKITLLHKPFTVDNLISHIRRLLFNAES